MVTKPTGRPRGRPKKQTAPEVKGERGRPPIPFLRDIDRYLVAMVEAHAIVNNTSERKAAEAIAAFQVGHEVDIPPEIAANCPPGMVAVGWGPATPIRKDGSIINTKPGGNNAATIKGRAATLREKLRNSRQSDDSNHWRTNMAAAFAIAFRTPVKNVREAKDFVLALTVEIGETATAINHILPMIDLAASG